MFGASISLIFYSEFFETSFKALRGLGRKSNYCKSSDKTWSVRGNAKMRHVLFPLSWWLMLFWQLLQSFEELGAIYTSSIFHSQIQRPTSPRRAYSVQIRELRRRSPQPKPPPSIFFGIFTEHLHPPTSITVRSAARLVLSRKVKSAKLDLVFSVNCPNSCATVVNCLRK